MRTQAPGEGEEQAYANYDPLSDGGTSKQWAESAAFHSLGDGSSATVQTGGGGLRRVGGSLDESACVG